MNRLGGFLSIALAFVVLSTAAQTNTPTDANERDVRAAMDRLSGGRPREALALLRGVIQRDPTNVHARAVAATALVEMNRHREARGILEGVVRDDPNKVASLNNLAWLLATAPDPQVRDPARALELARRAILEAPQDFHIWSTLSECHYQTGNYPMALRAAEQAKELATQAGIDDSRMTTYTEQVDKCRKAVNAFTLVE